MKNVIYFLMLAGIMITASCKNDGASEETTTVEKQTPNATPAQESTRDLAQSTMDFRREKDSESYAVIEAGIWNYDFVFNGREMSKIGEYDGEWIDFKPDFTYDYGSYDKVNGSGTFHYSFEDQLLLMLDNDTSKNPQEWETKHAGDVMVMVGRATYGKNSHQIKLSKSEDRPVKE